MLHYYYYYYLFFSLLFLPYLLNKQHIMLQQTIIIVLPYISLTFIFHIYYTVPQISESLLKIQWGFLPDKNRCIRYFCDKQNVCFDSGIKRYKIIICLLALFDDKCLGAKYSVHHWGLIVIQDSVESMLQQYDNIKILQLVLADGCPTVTHNTTLMTSW